MLQLVLIQTQTGTRTVLPLEGGALLGSAVDCDVVLPGTEIQPHHCKIEPHEGGFRITAVDAAEGLSLNDQWVSRARLRTGDVLKIGLYQIVVSAADSAAPPPAAAAPPPTAAAPPPAAVAAVPPPPPLVTVAPPPKQRPAAQRPAGDNRARTGRPRRVASTPGGGGGGTVMFIVGMLVIGTLGYAMFGGRGEEEVSASGFRSQMDRAMEQFTACRFDDLKESLDRMQAEYSSNGGFKQQIRSLQIRAETRKTRHENSLAEYAAAKELIATGQLERAASKIRRALDESGDLPIAQDLERLQTQVASNLPKTPSKYASLMSEGKTVEQWLAKVDEFLRVDEYGDALKILTFLDETSMATSDQLASFRSRIARDSAREGKKILELVQEYIKDGSLLIALNHLHDREIKNYARTDIWYDMLEKAEEIEDLIDASIGAENRPEPRVKHRRKRPTGKTSRAPPPESAESLAGTPAEKEPESVAGHGAERPPVDTGNRSSAELYEEARLAMQRHEFAGAESMLRGALDQAARADEVERISRLLDWSVRPRFLAETLALAIAQRMPGGNLDVRLRDGRRGQIVGSDGVMLVVKVAGADARVDPGSLQPQSLLKVSAKIPLDAQAALHRAFLALAIEDQRTFLGSVERAARDPELKAGVDSAIAYHRGMQRVPLRGFFEVDGEWLTFVEREALQVRAEVADALGKLARGADQDFESSREKVVEAAERMPEVVVAVLEAERDRLKQSFLEAPELTKIARLGGEREKLEQARTHALELIYDSEKYFYPYYDRADEYRRVQQEVEARVKAVRTLWGDEFGTEVPGISVSLSSGFRHLLSQIRWLRTLLDEVQGEAFRGDRELALAYTLPDWTRSLNLRTFALTEAEQDQFRSDAEVRRLNLSPGFELERGEQDQVVITNDYRAMMGRRRLALNEKLYRAARWHSDWMTRTGKFGHFEDDDPERRSPTDRMQKEGYTSGAGENCHRGAGSALGAHQGWFHSSGHHRNLLMQSHTEMATGQSGRFWTQNFGGGMVYTGNLIED